MTEESKASVVARSVDNMAGILSNPTSHNLLVVIFIVLLMAEQAYLNHLRATEVAVYIKAIEQDRHNEVYKMKELVAQCQIESKMKER